MQRYDVSRDAHDDDRLPSHGITDLAQGRRDDKGNELCCVLDPDKVFRVTNSSCNGSLIQTECNECPATVKAGVRTGVAKRTT